MAHKSGKKNYPAEKGHPGKPKFGTPEFFASLKKGKGKKVSKKRVRGGKK